MMRIGLAAIVWTALAAPLQARADGVDAEWIWFDEGDPHESAPAGKIWLRREARTDQPSTCQVRIACDDAFTLWVNGRKIGSGEGGSSHRFNLNGIVQEGVNVFAVEAENRGGPAGFLLDGVIRGQGGDETPIDTGPEWRVTRTAPAGSAWLEPRFAEDGWSAPQRLGRHAETRWKDIVFGDSYLDRYWLAEGFRIERVAEPDLAGSIVAFTHGNRGKLLVSKERGPILVLSDEDGDGKYDRAKPFSDKIKNCQGLLVVGADVYAVGDGPKETGLYRLTDADQDDEADSIERLAPFRGGMGEHGPHAVVIGPDGWLYQCIGNHASVRAEPQPTSPCRGWIEGYLLEPKFEDGRGHAAGIKAPGGTIWQFTPDGASWWMEANGFRNQYDAAVNEHGDVFTFDSDMEWDIGLPWYRPVRVNHCTSGAEFGWRSGAAKWPEHYFDSLPAAVDVGRGSPTGVVFYEHRQFPEKYRGSLLVCDWSMGRILAVLLQPNGAGTTATFETIATGNPLNVSDVEVDPDGSVLISTGGRNTEGGLYRIRYGDAASQPATAETLEELLDLPQITAAWAREQAAAVKESVGESWTPALLETARTGDPRRKIRALTLLNLLGPPPPADALRRAAEDESEKVRAFAAWLLRYHRAPEDGATLARLLSDPSPVVRRRACESFVRNGLAPPVEPLLDMLGSEDRFLRFAARLALERVPIERWKDAVLSAENDRVWLEGALALLRTEKSLDAAGAAARLARVLQRRPDLRLDALRLASLAVLAGAEEAAFDQFGRAVLDQFPTGDATTDMELARAAARLQVPGATDRILTALEAAPSQELQVHYALCLRYLADGWTPEKTRRYIRWYDGSRNLDGGHSFVPYLENIVSAAFPRLTPSERRTLIADWREHPYAARLLIRRNKEADIEDFPSLAEVVLAQIDASPEAPYASEIYDLCLDKLGESGDPRSQALLRRLFDENPDRRDRIAAKIAERPVPESREYLLRSLRFASPQTLQLCLRGLDRLDVKPEKPEEIRQVVLSGLKLGDSGGKVAVELLKEWTGRNPPEGDVAAALSFYQEWFRRTHPNEPPAELPKVDAEKERYTYDQLHQFLEDDPKGRAGDPERGKLAYAKAQCNKCHKFGSEGQGVGPDLTSLRRRFQRKEILEAIVFPSQVVSDQYRTVTVVTVDGLVQTGMLAAQEDADKLVLWLNNGERAEIAKEDVEEQKPSAVSLMPPALLNDLSLEEIADLFAYLETSKTNPEPASATAAGGGK
jgi:putative membrane-bound dehydrogenase-like protein